MSLVDGRKSFMPKSSYSIFVIFLMVLSSYVRSPKFAYLAKFSHQNLVKDMSRNSNNTINGKGDVHTLTSKEDVLLNTNHTLVKLKTSDKSSLSLQGNITLHKNPRLIALIHVGKTGGTTLWKLALPHLNCRHKRTQAKKAQCHIEASRDDSPLREASTLEFHMKPIQGGAKKVVEEKVSSFLFSTRNPVERAVSSYYFLHYNNRRQSTFARLQHPLKDDFYIKCFPTIKNLFEALDGVFQIASNSTMMMNRPTPCQKLSIEILQGKEEKTRYVNIHLYWNYQRYFDTSLGQFPSKEVFVIRLAHLWDDIIFLDQATGGSGKFESAGVASRKTVSTSKDPTSSIITSQQYKQLCCVLMEEIKVYQKLILRADNLNGEEKQEDLRQVSNICGAEVVEGGIVDWDDWHSRSCPNLDQFLS